MSIIPLAMIGFVLLVPLAGIVAGLFLAIRLARRNRAG